MGPPSSAEIYDPVAGTWTAAASMAMGLDGHSATLLLDGTVLVAGGVTDSSGSPTSSSEIHY
jgi:hypothetical protein